MVMSTGVPKSLEKAIIENPERFVKPLKGDTSIKDFDSFVSAMEREYGNNNAREILFSDLDKEVLRNLFESTTIQQTLVNNVGQEEADKQLQPGSSSSFVIPKPSGVQSIKVKGFSRSGKQIKTHSRSVVMRWSSAQTMFLSVRKSKGLSPKQIAKQYNKAFTETRSEVSIANKFYRV